MFSKMLYCATNADCEYSDYQLSKMEHSQYPELYDGIINESDEFRMYSFKINKCPITQSHDWTQCPYAHHGERARRRDPLKFNYAAVPCPEYNNGLGFCHRGDACRFAHGVFECWLHPAKYRTRPCHAGEWCRRKVCFFAHTPAELRGGPTGMRYQTIRPGEGVMGKAPGGGGDTSAKLRELAAMSGGGLEENSTDFLASLCGLSIKESGGGGGGEVSRSVFGWTGW